MTRSSLGRLGAVFALATLALAGCVDDPLKDDSRTAVGPWRKCLGFGVVPNITPYYSDCYSPYTPKKE